MAALLPPRPRFRLDLQQGRLPLMLTAGAGSIINIASTPQTFKIIRHTFPYPVAKHALLGMTRALGIEMRDRGIRVNAIAPGYIETQIAIDYWNSFPDPAAERQRTYDLQPPKRIGRPEDVAWTAVFLASDEAPFINAECVVVDGGRSVVFHDDRPGEVPDVEAGLSVLARISALPRADAGLQVPRPDRRRPSGYLYRLCEARFLCNYAA